MMEVRDEKVVGLRCAKDSIGSCFYVLIHASWKRRTFWTGVIHLFCAGTYGVTSPAASRL